MGKLQSPNFSNERKTQYLNFLIYVFFLNKWQTNLTESMAFAAVDKESANQTRNANYLVPLLGLK